MTRTNREMVPFLLSLQQSLWCSIVERLEYLVLSVYCVPSYCLLTPLMSPRQKM